MSIPSTFRPTLAFSVSCNETTQDSENDPIRKRTMGKIRLDELGLPVDGDVRAIRR